MPLRNLLVLLSLLLPWQAATAEMVVVGNPKSGVERLSRDEVVSLYFGRGRLLPSGMRAEPIDLPRDHPTTALFYSRLVGKSPAEVNAYWARLVFSGKTQPPPVLPSVEEALAWVASHSGGLAYVDRSKVSRQVVIVFELGD